MSRGVGAMLLAVLLAAACQQGDAGNLEPINGQSAAWGSAESAVVRDGAVSATVTARWAAEASQGADIVYRNDGTTPVSVILSRLTLRHERLGEAPLWAASDMTDVDRKDARTDNDDPPVVYDMDTSPSTTQLLLKPGERRTLNVGFTNFPGNKRIARGDQVSVTVPLGTGDRTVEMVAD